MIVPKTINPSKVANNPLVPRYIKDDISKTVGALVLMQTYATWILQQSELSLNIGSKYEILSNLNPSQKVFKRHANYLINFLMPSLVDAVSDINTYGKVLQSFQLASLEIIPKISKENDARYRLIALLNQLEVEARKRKITAQKLMNTLNNFKAQIKIDKDNFNSELERANQNISAAMEELDKLPAQSKNPQKEIQRKIAGVLVASFVIVGGAAIIGLESLATLPTNITATSVILGGISVIIAAAGTLVNIGSSLADYSNQLWKPYQINVEIYTNIGLVNDVAEHFESLFETTNYMVEAHNALSIEWSSILAGIKSFKQEIIGASNMSNIVQIEANLKLASREWDLISKRAQEMVIRVGSLKPEEVNKVLNWSTPYPLIP